MGMLVTGQTPARFLSSDLDDADVLRSRSSFGASTRFDSVAYSELKSRVHSLKREQQRIVRTEQEARQVESSALLEQKQKYDAEIKGLQDQMAGLQAQLRQNTERSAKMRQHFERDKKALQAQLDKVTKTLEGVDAEHTSKMAELTTRHEAEVRQLQQEVAQAREELERERASHVQDKAAAVEEVDQWCQGEIEAVRHVCGKQAEALHAELEQWKDKWEAERGAREQAEAAAQQAAQQQSDAGREAQALSSQLEQSRAECEALRGELEGERAAGRKALEELAAQLRAQAEDEVTNLKAKHSQQLDLVAARLQDVVGRKDAAISALKAELSAVTAKLAQFERLLGGPGGL